MDFLDPTDLDPALAEVLDDAYASSIGVETAARHLWVIHSEARKMAEEKVLTAAAAVLDQSADAQPALRSLAGRRIPRAAVPLLALMMMMSSSGVAVAASQNSLPGELLYGVKRTTERAQLVMARNPAARAELQLEFALTRLAEIEAVAETRPEVVPDLVTDINVSLTDVQRAPPEIAAQVAPQRESIRQQTSEQIAALELPPEIGIAVGVAMTAVPQDEMFTATGVPSPAPSGGATAPASGDGDQAAVAASTAGPNEEGDGTEVAEDPTPLEEELVVDPDAAAVLDEEAAEDQDPDDQVVTDDESPASDDASPAAQNGAPAAGPAGQSSSPSSPSATPTASPSPEEEGEVIEEDTSTADGPAITSRPHPSDQAGADRGGEDDSGVADGSPAHTPPTSEPAGEDDVDQSDGAAEPPATEEEPSPPADQAQDEGPSDSNDAVEESSAGPATHYHRPGS